MFYDKTVLKNGVTVISQTLPGFRSVTLGVWVGVGSRDEAPEVSGLSHFMEHMLFKGTEKYNAEELSIAFDEIGAENNAFTSKECTCFYARFIDRRLPEALALLADMVVNSQFEQECIDSEREVVIEEIARSEDAPDDYVFDLAAQAMWPTTPLGRPILGTRDIVGGFETADCLAYHKAHYTAGNIVVAAAGNVNHAELVRLSEELFAALPAGKRVVRAAVTDERLAFNIKKKETEQAHIIYALPGMPSNDPQRFEAMVLDAVLGSGMSSRLFQEVREKRGLAYAVSSYTMSYAHAGSFAVYAGTRPSNLEEVVTIIRRELERALAEGITQSELDRARESLVSQLIMRSEAPKQRMASLGRGELLGLDLLSLDEQEARIRAVTLDDVLAVAPRMLAGTPSVAVISPYEEQDVTERLAALLA